MAPKHHARNTAHAENTQPDPSAYTPGTGPETDIPVNPETGETTAPESTAPVMEQVHLPKKIVAKDIVPRKDLVYRKDTEGKVVNEEPRQLYRVFGTAMGTVTGDSQYGPWVGFTGSFEAIRFSDRARFKSTRLHLADPAEGLLLQALADVQKEDKGGTVQFAFDVGVKVSQKWIDTDQGNTYEYTIQSVLSVAKNDPLAAIRSQMLTNLPQLAAPTP